MKKDYTKLGGWMIYFIIVQILGSIIVIKDYGDLTTQFDSLSYFMDLGIIPTILILATLVYIVGAIAGLAGIGVRNRKAILVHFVTSGAYLLLMGIMFVLMTNTFDFVDTSSFQGPFIASMARSTVVLVIWIYVFKTSERAKVYFGEQSPVVETVEVEL